MKFPLISLVMVLLFVACGDQTKQQADSLEDQVMTIHDEVMPQTAVINQMAQQIRRQTERLKDELAHTDEQAGADIMDRLPQMEEALMKLEVAEQSMMNWMRTYSKAYVKQKANMTQEERLTFLQAEVPRIEAVRDEMLSSIEEAQAFMPETE